MNRSRPPQTAGLPLETITASERPWGGFEQLVHNEAVTVKVIDGPADVEVEGHPSIIDTGRRARIPRGSTHRLGNPGTETVRVLEMAFGHFDEDDIERLVDDDDRVDPSQRPEAGRPCGPSA